MAPGPVSHPHEGDCRLLCPCDFVCVDGCVFVWGWGVLRHSVPLTRAQCVWWLCSVACVWLWRVPRHLGVCVDLCFQEWATVICKPVCWACPGCGGELARGSDCIRQLVPG